MNIFKRFKKRNKHEVMERLFDKIVAMFPDGSVSLDVHRIELAELDKRIWKIERIPAGTCDKPYAIATRINKKNAPNVPFDITLFGEDKQ